MGVVILAVALLYLLISLGVVYWALQYAWKHDKSQARWGWGAALVMFLIPFWDWLPTVAVHQYTCATEAGFWVYKTPEQWRKENPGVMEGLVGHEQSPTKHVGDDNNFTITYFLNERFNWIVSLHGRLPINRWRYEYEVVDVKTGEVLGRYVDFSTSQSRRGGGFGESGWKFWLDNGHCSGGRHNKSEMGNFMEHFAGKKQ